MSSSRPDHPGAPPVGHLADLVSRAAVERPGHDAIRDVSGPSPSTLSWAEFDAAVTAEAGRLRAAGVRPGDRVAVALPDGAALCVALLGALRADAAVVPLAPDSVPRELEAVLGQAAPAAVVADPDDRFAAAAAAACGACVLTPPDPAAAP